MPANTAIILSTYGEPTQNTFRDQWMYSYRILKRLTRKIAKIPSALLPLISTVRAQGRVSLWKEHAFTSPLEPLTDDTVTKLRELLESRGVTAAQVMVARAYEFRKPLLADVITSLRAKGIERFIIVPMYIGGGDFTDGMTAIAVEDVFTRCPDLPKSALEYCYLSDTAEKRDRLAHVMVQHVFRCVRERGIELPATDWAVLLAAHGTVQTSPPEVDNGIISFGEVGWRIYRQVREQVGVARLGWLNHTKGGRWTEPAADRALDRLRQMGYAKLIYFPWGFTTDNAESALEGRVFCQAMQNPFERVEHLPCINTNSDFIAYLADITVEQLQRRSAEPDVVSAAA